MGGEGSDRRHTWLAEAYHCLHTYHLLSSDDDDFFGDLERKDEGKGGSSGGRGYGSAAAGGGGTGRMKQIARRCPPAFGVPSLMMGSIAADRARASHATAVATVAAAATAAAAAVNGIPIGDMEGKDAAAVKGKPAAGASTAEEVAAAPPAAAQPCSPMATEPAARAGEEAGFSATAEAKAKTMNEGQEGETAVANGTEPNPEARQPEAPAAEQATSPRRSVQWRDKGAAMRPPDVARKSAAAAGPRSERAAERKAGLPLPGPAAMAAASTAAAATAAASMLPPFKRGDRVCYLGRPLLVGSTADTLQSRVDAEISRIEAAARSTRLREYLPSIVLRTRLARGVSGSGAAAMGGPRMQAPCSPSIGAKGRVVGTVGDRIDVAFDDPFVGGSCLPGVREQCGWTGGAAELALAVEDREDPWVQSFDALFDAIREAAELGPLIVFVQASGP